MRVVYGGGGMIRPNFYKREVYRDFLLRDNKIHFSIYGVGINKDILEPNFSLVDKRALRDWISSAKKVTVRDYYTKNFLNKIFHRKYFVAPCPSYQVIRSVKTAREKEYDIGIVISLGHTKTYKKYYEKIISFVKEVSVIVGQRNLGIICHDIRDYETAQKLFNSIKIYYVSNSNSVKKIYSKFKGIITFRAHGIIFAAACNSPCSPLVLNKKLETLYYYHYRKKPLKLNFNPRKHLLYLKNNYYSRNI